MQLWVMATVGSLSIKLSNFQVPRTGLQTPFRDSLVKHIAEEVVKLARVMTSLFCILITTSFSCLSSTCAVMDGFITEFCPFRMVWKEEVTRKLDF